MGGKMKQCKACGSEIAKSAKACPNCGAKQKGVGKIILGIVLALFVVVAIAGISGKDDSSKINNSGSNTNATTATAETGESNDKEAKGDEETEGDKYLLVGGTYEDKDIKFTVDSADLEYELKSDEYGLYTLGEGLHYISVSFSFENIGTTDKYVSIYDFDCYADNNTCEQQFVTGDTGDFINTNLSPGRNTSFMVLFAVPDGAESIELEYEPNIWSNEKVLIKLK